MTCRTASDDLAPGPSAQADWIEAQQGYADLSHRPQRLVSAGAEWKWRGRAHQLLTMHEGSPRSVHTGPFRVVRHADGGNRVDKFERRLVLLQADARDDPKGTPRPSTWRALAEYAG